MDKEATKLIRKTIKKEKQEKKSKKATIIMTTSKWATKRKLTKQQ
jgi:hypothetical protein